MYGESKVNWFGQFYVLVCRKQKTKFSYNIFMTFSGSRNGIFDYLLPKENDFVSHS
eukprot:UN24234